MLLGTHDLTPPTTPSARRRFCGALCHLTSVVQRDPVHSTRHVRQRKAHRHKQSLYDNPPLRFSPANHTGHIRRIE